MRIHRKLHALKATNLVSKNLFKMNLLKIIPYVDLKTCKSQITAQLQAFLLTSVHSKKVSKINTQKFSFSKMVYPKKKEVHGSVEVSYSMLLTLLEFTVVSLVKTNENTDQALIKISTSLRWQEVKESAHLMTLVIS